MIRTRRDFIQAGLALAGATGLTFTKTAAYASGTHFGLAASPAAPVKETLMTTQAATTPQSSLTSQQATANVLGGDKFDPAKWLEVPPRTFEDLKVGDVFRAPSRTHTDAHTSEFQAISGDNHPRHYNDVYAKSIGLKAALIQPLQLLALSAPGACLFTHYVGPSIVGLTGTSCEYLVDSFAGDTMYPALEVTALSTANGQGFVTTAIMIYNQRGQLVLSGQHKFTLKLSA